jgi:hypothetical protein
MFFPPKGGEVCMKLLSTGALYALFAASALTLPACSSGPGYVSGGAAVVVPSRPYYQVRDRYYHCHPGGVCHGVRHPNYYWSGGGYRPRPPGYRPPHHSVRPMPHPRPRPRPR